MLIRDLVPVDMEILRPSDAFIDLVEGKTLDLNRDKSRVSVVPRDCLLSPCIVAPTRIIIRALHVPGLGETEFVKKSRAETIRPVVNSCCRQLHGNEGERVISDCRVLKEPFIRIVITVGYNVVPFTGGVIVDSADFPGGCVSSYASRKQGDSHDKSQQDRQQFCG